MTETTAEPAIDAWDRVVDRLRLREQRYLDGDQVYILEDAFLDAVSACLIERQQKAIDLLLKAIEPFAEAILPINATDTSGVRAFYMVADIRAARSAKEQAERVLKREES